MRLLFLNHNCRYGGTYYRAMPMAEQLVQRGHEVTFFTVSRQHRWKATWTLANGVRLCETPNLAQGNSGEGYGPLDITTRILHTLGHTYDVIHMFDHKPNATFAGFIGGRLRSTCLISDWGDWWGGVGGINDVPKRRIPAIGKFEAWWEPKSKLWSDGVVAISTVLRDRALDIGCSPERVLHLPTGAPLDRIQSIPIATARKKLGVPEKRRIVGFIGMGQWDLEIVMRALQKLPDVWLMIIGHKNPRVLEWAQTLEVADRLWQTGFVPDAEVSYYLSCADAMCLPLTDRAANRGRFPNKILDYMSAGRPTVASPIGDIKRIFEEHPVGLLADDTQFTEALGKLLDDEQLRDTLGAEARHVAETTFNWATLIPQLEDFYRRIQRL